MNKKIWLPALILSVVLVSAGVFLWSTKRDTPPTTLQEVFEKTETTIREKVRDTATRTPDDQVEVIEYIVETLDLKDCEFMDFTFLETKEAECTYTGDSVDPKYYETDNILISVEPGDTPILSLEDELDIICLSKSSSRTLRDGGILIEISIFKLVLLDPSSDEVLNIEALKEIEKELLDQLGDRYDFEMLSDACS